jgi:hypothetical protein
LASIEDSLSSEWRRDTTIQTYEYAIIERERGRGGGREEERERGRRWRMRWVV